MNASWSKECFKCKQVKDKDEFYKHKQMMDGRLNKCKECTKADVQSNYRNNIDHYKEYERARAGLSHRVESRKDYLITERGRSKSNSAKHKWNIRNPIKKMASTIVGNAVRDGRLKKPNSCESCLNEPIRLHGHHDDYAFPLVVRWLCPGCHTKWHKENGEGKNAQ